MPEEINRVVTDRLSDLLFTPSRDAVQNLLAEGILAERIHMVGNIMIDTLVALLPRARQAGTTVRFGLAERPFVFVTLHRPNNVDAPGVLRELLDTLAQLAIELPVLFPVHPRTRARIGEMGWTSPPSGALRFLDPLPYIDTLSLVAQASLVITDSGGLQEETSFLGVPCLTVRSSTERPITCVQGTNRLVQAERGAILAAAGEALANPRREPRPIERWDGKTADRILDVLLGKASYGDQ
jgi:UDP-N-acetylglucosamine 2-epimerase (non-hydrolysing)